MNWPGEFITLEFLPVLKDFPASRTWGVMRGDFKTRSEAHPAR